MRTIALFTLFQIAFVLSAQQSNTLFLMHDVPQSNLLNPAVQLKCKWFIGLPVLGTTHVNYSNTAFSVNSVLVDDEVNFEQAYNDLQRMNMISADIISYPIMLGYRRGINYFTFTVSEHLNTYNSFSKRLAGLALYGNTQFIGETARLSNTRVNASYFREYAAGFSTGWDRYTTIGIRAKLLFGKAGVRTGASQLLLGTDEDSFDLSVRGKVSFNTSFPLLLTQNSRGIITNVDVPELDYRSLLLNPRNVGLAGDFGIIHTYSKNLTLSAAVLDLGAILWTDETYNVSSDVDFLYQGITSGNDFSDAAYFRDLADSLVNEILYDLTEQSYLSPLPLQIFLGAEYQWKEHISLGLVSRNFFMNRRVHPSLTVSANASILKSLNLSLSWSYLDHSFLNAGAGIAYSGRGLQLYLVSDNVLGLIWPLDAYTLNFRFGMNLMLGCPRNRNNTGKNYPDRIPLGNCNWIEKERAKKRPKRF